MVFSRSAGEAFTGERNTAKRVNETEDVSLVEEKNGQMRIEWEDKKNVVYYWLKSYNSL